MSQVMRTIVVLNVQERYIGAFACELLQRLGDVRIVLLGPRLAPLEALRATLKSEERARCWTHECEMTSRLATHTTLLWLQASLGDFVQLVLEVKQCAHASDDTPELAHCAETHSYNFLQEAAKLLPASPRYWQVHAQELATQAKRERLVATIKRLEGVL